MYWQPKVKHYQDGSDLILVFLRERLWNPKGKKQEIMNTIFL
jgi:hypothetical protein